MKSWKPISNGGRFYVQWSGSYVMHEDLRVDRFSTARSREPKRPPRDSTSNQEPRRQK